MAGGGGWLWDVVCVVCAAGCSGGLPRLWGWSDGRRCVSVVLGWLREACLRCGFCGFLGCMIWVGGRGRSGRGGLWGWAFFGFGGGSWGAEEERGGVQAGGGFGLGGRGCCGLV